MRLKKIGLVLDICWHESNHCRSSNSFDHFNILTIFVANNTLHYPLYLTTSTRYASSPKTFFFNTQFLNPTNIYIPALPDITIKKKLIHFSFMI